MNVKVLVCCHKPDVFAKDDTYFPIQVGKALSRTDLGVAGDNTGDNISEKNQSYCELTGLYWAWKNLPEADIYGLCHYRRYFDFHHQGQWGRALVGKTSSDFPSLDLSIPEDIIDSVVQGSIVVPKPLVYPFPLMYDYAACHNSEDFRTLEKIIRSTQESRISDAFFELFYRSNKLRHFNMFLANRKNFNDYCEWVFPVLEEVERNTSIRDYSPAQKRIYGYMAERLFNVWLEGTGKNLIEKPVIWVNDNYHQDSWLHDSLRTVKRNMSNLLIRSKHGYWEAIEAR